MDSGLRTYSELILLPTYEERLAYLSLDGIVGVDTFGYTRYLNQILYNSPEWRHFRREMIIRDNGCDLALPGYEIPYKITLHHINPIAEEDIIKRAPCLMDPENVICVSDLTHRAIHYGMDYKPNMFVERRPGDTTLW